MIALPHSTREQARFAYLAGERVTEIAKDLGLQRATVSQWVRRENWKAVRKAIVTRTTETIGRTVEDVTACNAALHQEQVYRFTKGSLHSLARFQPKKAQEFVQVGQALKHFDDVGRRNLGLDVQEGGGGGQKVFNVSLGSFKLPERVVEAKAVQPPAIEVESKVV